MFPKGKLLALLMIFTAVGGLAATGAFTTVQAERTADVNVAGDADALLAIQPVEDESASSFIQQSSTADSTFAINLDGDEGLNANATTTAEDLFNITNNGNESVDVWISTNGGVQAGNNSVNTTFYINGSKVGGGNGDEVTANSDAVDLTGSPNSPIDEYTAFVDSGDKVISNSTTASGTPDKEGIAVKIDSGETVTVSFAAEIEDESDLGSNINDDQILQNITVLAVNDEGNNINEGLETS